MASLLHHPATVDSKMSLPIPVLRSIRFDPRRVPARKRSGYLTSRESGEDISRSTVVSVWSLYSSRVGHLILRSSILFFLVQARKNWGWN